MSNIRPLPGFVCVKIIEVENKSASGFIVPDSEDKKPTRGLVIEVGKSIFKDGEKIESPVKKGETVVFQRWSLTDTIVDAEKYQFIKFEDLLAVLE